MTRDMSLSARSTMTPEQEAAWLAEHDGLIATGPRWSANAGPTMTDAEFERVIVESQEPVPFPHGTNAGYEAERLRQVDPCDACRRAMAAYNRSRYELSHPNARPYKPRSGVAS